LGSKPVIDVRSYGAQCDGVTDDTTAINNALAAASGGVVLLPSGLVCIIGSHLAIPNSMTGGMLYGEGATIKASSSFSDTSMLVVSSGVSVFKLQGMLFDAANKSSLTSPIVNLSVSETSIRDNVVHVRIENAPDALATIGFSLDGCEDSNIDGGTEFTVAGPSYPTPGTGQTLNGATAVSWHVPSGNVRIQESVLFGRLYLSYQSAELTKITTGAVICDGVCWSVGLSGIYSYADPVLKANFDTTGTNAFGGMTISGGSYFIAAPSNNAVSFQGHYQDGVTIDFGDYWDGVNVTGYSLLGSTTLAQAGTQPIFTIWGAPNLTEGSIGTPGTGIQTMLCNDIGGTASCTFSFPLNVGTIASNVTFSGSPLFTGGVPSFHNGAIVVNSANATGNPMLQLENAYSTPVSKYIRVPSTGDLQILNSAYSVTIFDLQDNGTLGLSPTPTAFTGTSGAGQCSQAFGGSGALKIVNCSLGSYAQTGAAQTYTFPYPFVVTPILLMTGGSCGTYNPTTTTTVLTLPANSGMTPESCNIALMGQ
jgi:hypothetical protein